jgi:hypothetical protein
MNITFTLLHPYFFIDVESHQKQIEELELARRTSTEEISKLQKLIEELQNKPKDDSELERLRQVHTSHIINNIIISSLPFVNHLLFCFFAL